MFYAGEDLWVSEASGALHFPTTQNAIAHVLQNQVEDVQVVVTDSGKQPLVFPVELPP